VSGGLFSLLDSKVMKKLWIVSQFLILAYVQIDFLILHNEEALMKLIALEIIITFPVSMVVIYTVIVIMAFKKVNIELLTLENGMYIGFIWLLFAILGYIQWFNLLPKIYIKIFGEKGMHQTSVNRYLLVATILFVGFYLFLLFLM
jgi:hypothetical protein